jgi:hypothetical protein
MTTADSHIGTWRLVSFEVQDADGGIACRFARDVEGFITYTGDGWMAVRFGRANRACLAVPDWVAGTDADIAAVRRLYAEVRQRADRFGQQHGIDQFKQGIGTAIEAVMQCSSEGTRGHERA